MVQVVTATPLWWSSVLRQMVSCKIHHSFAQFRFLMKGQLSTLVTLCLFWHRKRTSALEDVNDGSGGFLEHSSEEYPFDYSKKGPLPFSTYTLGLPLPPELHSSVSNNLTLTVRVPSAHGVTPPFPVLVWFNGFQTRSSMYSRILDHAATWGYGTVSYNTPFGSLITVEAELQVFPVLLSYLAQNVDSPSSPLFRRLSLDHIVTAGHSRGGKIATILYTMVAEYGITAAYLVDPVDVSRWAPDSKENPSAARLLREAGNLAIGISGAGIISSCNPTEGNFWTLWDAAAGGSWLSVIPGASHSTFVDAGPVLNVIQDALCGRGSSSRSEVAELSVTPMLNWFWKQLTDKGIAPPRIDALRGKSPEPSFMKWIERSVEDKKISQFDVKGLINEVVYAP